jgi:hypothetical protein
MYLYILQPAYIYYSLRRTDACALYTYTCIYYSLHEYNIVGAYMNYTFISILPIFTTDEYGAALLHALAGQRYFMLDAMQRGAA